MMKLPCDKCFKPNEEQMQQYTDSKVGTVWYDDNTGKYFVLTQEDGDEVTWKESEYYTPNEF